MPDIEALKKAVSWFSFHSRPSSGDYSAPCTVGDLNKVIDNLAKTLNVFISELEQE